MLDRNYSHGPAAPRRSHSSSPPAFLDSTDSEILRKFAQLDINQSQRQYPNGGSPGHAERWARESGAEVAERNRYFNIEPWAVNRVRLNVPPGQCDYINASHVELKHSRSGLAARFIATQGPKETSRGHFWHMIWDSAPDPAVVVMLTQTHEGGKEKCAAYFPQDLHQDRVMYIGNPDSQDTQTQGSKAVAVDGEFRATIELQACEYDDSTRCTVRTLRLSSGGQHKTVRHYLYSVWPDFLVPEGADRRALLKLAQATAQDSGDGPRVVHCSAGVGRSGSFIALDYLVGELAEGSLDAGSPLLKEPNADPIADTVDRLREQRMMMVQGEGQFVFLYRMMRELWFERQGTAAARV